ncbi:ABC-2 family transporter protein [Candidatus Uhrbacteria bacterium]|nr:ABC-2 family transporter protein [Candidatus Uhrbacteria bacterium]
MRRYFRILKVLVRVSFIRDIVFRGAFYIDLFHAVLWLGLFFLVIEVFFSHTESIVGWTKGNLIVLLGIWSLLDDLASGTFWEGVKRIPTLVADGNMDFILTRPVDSQFLIAAERFRFSRVIPLIADIALISYGLSIGSIGSLWTILLGFPIVIIAGYLTVLSVFYLLHTLGFWFLRIDNIWALYEGIENIGKYPLDVFGRHIKLVSLTVVPLTVMFTLPAEALVGFLSGAEVINALLVSALFLWLTRKFYQYSVRRYSSVA